jgi:hypothetical protein
MHSGRRCGTRLRDPRALILVLAILGCSADSAPAAPSQSPPPAPLAAATPVPETAGMVANEVIEPATEKGGRWMTRDESLLSCLVLGFGLVVMLIQYATVRGKKVAAETALRFVLLTLIVVGTIFLVVGGFSDQQIAPAVGLFGTIAGYVLGRTEKRPAAPAGEQK